MCCLILLKVESISVVGPLIPDSSMLKYPPRTPIQRWVGPTYLQHREGKATNRFKVKTWCPWEQPKINHFQLCLPLFTPWYKNGCSGKGKAKAYHRWAALLFWEISTRISSETVPVGLWSSSLLHTWECQVWLCYFYAPPFNYRTLNKDSSWLAQWSWTFLNSRFDYINFCLGSYLGYSSCIC